MTVVLVAVGAALGAPLRYVTDRAVQGRHDTGFAWGTLVVNVFGCLLLGLVTAIPVSTRMVALLGTGFCGALTTYSTFGHDVFRLLLDRAFRAALLNVTLTVLAGLGAAYCGSAIGRALL